MRRSADARVGRPPSVSKDDQLTLPSVSDCGSLGSDAGNARWSGRSPVGAHSPWPARGACLREGLPNAARSLGEACAGGLARGIADTAIVGKP